MRELTFAESINEAIDQAMEADERVMCFGLGATDPKTIFGTTKGLEKKYGKDRVFDTPTSENAMTGIGIGASIGGMLPLMTHQRLDFFLLAMDQLVNSAAKWHYMFGSKRSVPITIRLIVGRGWGQGPTHSQNLQSWFAHIPGLKVVMPSSAYDAKGLLLESIFDPNPVLFLEHRWLHNLKESVPEKSFRIPIASAKRIREGKDLTIVAMSYLNIEAEKAAEFLSRNFGVDIELIDLRSVRPIDWNTIISSIDKTRRILALDTGVGTCSVSSEIISFVSCNKFNDLLCAPQKIAMPEIPEPTSFALTKEFYIRAGDVAKVCLNMLDIKYESSSLDVLKEPELHDIPGNWFTGPF